MSDSENSVPHASSSSPLKHRRHLTNQERETICKMIADLGRPPKQVANELGIPPSTVYAVYDAFRRRGDSDAIKSLPPNNSVLQDNHLAFLKHKLDDDVNLTNKQLNDHLEKEFGFRVHESTIGKAIKRAGYSFKRVYEQVKLKNSDRIKDQRKEFAETFMQHAPPIHRIFYVDESGFNANQHRLRGRAPKGQRAIKQVKTIRAPNFTLIAAIGMQGLVLKDVRMGGVKGTVFKDAMGKLFDHLEQEGFVDDEAVGVDPKDLPEQPIEPDVPPANMIEEDDAEDAASDIDADNDAESQEPAAQSSSSAAAAPASSSAAPTLATSASQLQAHHSHQVENVHDNQQGAAAARAPVRGRKRRHQDDDDDDDDEYYPTQAEFQQDQAEEGNDNSEYIVQSEEHPGVSFPQNKRYKAWIVLDNCRIHKTEQVREFFAERGYCMVFLPAYSSFLNPIEYVFNTVKADFKKHSLETGESVSQRIRQATAAVTPEGCQNTINHINLTYVTPCLQREEVTE
ncbi:hypothetical protein CAOG_009762 [Capsaspora owczarzaki ATCC 30864]|uniref:Tc1-like transposase DDE domain-containing protein n=2 Tax=Capsaspora owczarzaki TaxID=192875 RepID=A0A0D2VRN2_CAPO3|nr:hypothetical protein CAOG_009762 [Capsaspora owczarzaki ATCC 30864]FAA01107.1 TPA: transposase [Capsaspora owczarzaki]